MDHFGVLEKEEMDLEDILNIEWADYYLKKVEKRLPKLLEGEPLGDMVESEFEGL